MQTFTSQRGLTSEIRIKFHRQDQDQPMWFSMVFFLDSLLNNIIPVSSILRGILQHKTQASIEFSMTDFIELFDFCWAESIYITVKWMKKNPSKQTHLYFSWAFTADKVLIANFSYICLTKCLCFYSSHIFIVVTISLLWWTHSALSVILSFLLVLQVHEGTWKKPD